MILDLLLREVTPAMGMIGTLMFADDMVMMTEIQRQYNTMWRQ